jgi:hypothetical protein
MRPTLRYLWLLLLITTSVISCSVAAKTPKQATAQELAACVEKLKGQMLTGTLQLEDREEVPFDDDAMEFNLPLTFGLLKEESFNRTYERDAKIFSGLSLNRTYIFDAKEFDITWELSLDSDSNVLYLKIDANVVNDHQPLKNLAQKYQVNAKDCSLTYHQSEHTTIVPKEGRAQVTEEEHFALGNEGKKKELLVPWMNVANLLRDFEQEVLQKEGNDCEVCAPIFANTDLPNALIKIARMKDEILCYDPQKEAQLPFKQYRYKLEVDGTCLRTKDIFFRHQDEFRFSTSEDSASEDQSVNRQFWEKTTLSYFAPKYQVVGLEKSDLLIKTPLRLTVDAKFEWNQSLIQHYLDYKELESPEQNKDNAVARKYYQVQAKNIIVPKAVALKTESLPEDLAYLKSTAYLQVKNPEIQKIARELTKDFEGDRLEMAQKISQKIDLLLETDKAMIEADSIRILSTEEILKRKKGVCQHYANLYVTLARAVGIPARIIAGRHISYQGNAAHAWVELNLDNKIWTPIEPQNEELTPVSDRNELYLPTAVLNIYETQSEQNIDVSNYQDYRSLLQEMKVEKIFRPEKSSK